MCFVVDVAVVADGDDVVNTSSEGHETLPTSPIKPECFAQTSHQLISKSARVCRLVLVSMCGCRCVLTPCEGSLTFSKRISISSL